MKIATLRKLVKIRDLGSFAEVARADDIDPSKLSRLVARAEADLGFRVFQRSTRSLSITAEGEAYLSRVAPLVDELNDAAEVARTCLAEPSGSLRIGCSVAFGTMCLVPLLSDFQTANPSITLELVSDDQPTDLVSSGLDISLRLAPEVHGDLICSRLASTTYHVCATPEVADTLRTPAALALTPVLRQSLPGYRDAWLFEAPDGTTTNHVVHGSLLISNPLALLEATIQGLGPALLADWVSDRAVQQGKLVRLWQDHRVTATNFDTALWLLYPSRSYLPARTRVGIDFLRQSFAS